MKEKIITTTICVIVLAILISPIICLEYAHYSNRNTYIVTVTDKDVKRSGESDKYMIFTKLENGDIRVFKNEDELFLGKFNSSDLHAEIEVGKTYEINTVGYRWEFMSAYENILDIKEMRDKDE